MKMIKREEKETKNRSPFTYLDFLNLKINVFGALTFVVFVIMIVILLGDWYNLNSEKCFNKTLFKESVNVKLTGEKPEKIENFSDYSKVSFSDNKVIYLCRTMGYDIKGDIYSLADSLGEYPFYKDRGADYFFIDLKNENQIKFYMDWSKYRPFFL